MTERCFVIWDQKRNVLAGNQTRLTKEEVTSLLPTLKKAKRVAGIGDAGTPLYSWTAKNWLAGKI